MPNLDLADPEAPRFVWWDKQLRPTPDGLASLPTFTLLSIFGKIRAGLGAIGACRPAPPRPAGALSPAGESGAL